MGSFESFERSPLRITSMTSLCISLISILLCTAVGADLNTETAPTCTASDAAEGTCAKPEADRGNSMLQKQAATHGKKVVVEAEPHDHHSNIVKPNNGDGVPSMIQKRKK